MKLKIKNKIYKLNIIQMKFFQTQKKIIDIDSIQSLNFIFFCY